MTDRRTDAGRDTGIPGGIARDATGSSSPSDDDDPVAAVRNLLHAYARVPSAASTADKAFDTHSADALRQAVTQGLTAGRYRPPWSDQPDRTLSVWRAAAVAMRSAVQSDPSTTADVDLLDAVTLFLCNPPATASEANKTPSRPRRVHTFRRNVKGIGGTARP